MSELICPCGHSAHNHGNNGCLAGWPVKFTCDCTNKHADAILEVQRAQAIAHLRELANRLNGLIPGFTEWRERMREIFMVADAYRAIGILPERK